MEHRTHDHVFCYIAVGDSEMLEGVLVVEAMVVLILVCKSYQSSRVDKYEIKPLLKRLLLGSVINIT